jgi:hypothetical protein
LTPRPIRIPHPWAIRAYVAARELEEELARAKAAAADEARRRQEEEERRRLEEEERTAAEAARLAQVRLITQGTHTLARARAHTHTRYK